MKSYDEQMTAQLNWHYITKGDRSLPPLIFLHGFMGISSDWLEITKTIENEYFCILPDLPGHGKSIIGNMADPLDFDLIAMGLLNLMECLQLASGALIGYSMGARVALYVATKHPERFKALVLEGVNPGLQDDQEREKRLALDYQRAREIEKMGISSFIDIWYAADLFKTLESHPERFNMIKTLRKNNNTAWMAKVLRELSVGMQPSLWDKLDELNMPVLLIAGELDDKYKKIVHRIKDYLKDSQVNLISDAGHNTHLEEPEQFSKTLKYFLKEKYLYERN